MRITGANTEEATIRITPEICLNKYIPQSFPDIYRATFGQVNYIQPPKNPPP